MFEFAIILSITGIGSLVRLSASLILHHFAVKSQSDTITAGPDRGFSDAPAPAVDPVLRFGFILALDGAIVLALTSALPGDLALERTAFAFALLCAGGLIGEIAGGGRTRPMPDGESDDEETPVHGGGTSRLLSAALTLMLNVSLAVLCTGQGLIEIVPPKSVDSSYTQELDPVIVVAKRTRDPLYEDGAR